MAIVEKSGEAGRGAQGAPSNGVHLRAGYASEVCGERYVVDRGTGGIKKLTVDALAYRIASYVGDH